MTSLVQLPTTRQLRNFLIAAVSVMFVSATTWAADHPVVEVPNSNATSAAEMKPYTDVISNTEVKFDMLPIPGGKFTMGSPSTEKGHNADEGPQHEVQVEPFWMGKCEVTWDEFEVFMFTLDIERRKVLNEKTTENDKLADALARPTKPYTDMSFGMGKDGFPAISMTHYAARMYCHWLSAKTGRYYRLPTEAEWEYACRAGTKTAYSFGDDPAKLGDYAWYFENAGEAYKKVGKKKPNPWGLYDMHGNVAEWVLDQYIADYYSQFKGKTAVEPLAITQNLVPAPGSRRLVAGRCRSAAQRRPTGFGQRVETARPATPAKRVVLHRRPVRRISVSPAAQGADRRGKGQNLGRRAGSRKRRRQIRLAAGGTGGQIAGGRRAEQQAENEPRLRLRFQPRRKLRFPHSPDMLRVHAVP